MELIIIIAVVLFVEIVKTLNERKHRRFETGKTKIFMESMAKRIEEISRKVEDTSHITTESLLAASKLFIKIEKENEKFIKIIEDEFVKELEKAEDEKNKATSELSIFVAAIKSLDLNYRRKIQFQIDRIVQTKKQEPATKKTK
jgi:hypothetical protein